jgi:hypothetical protein
MVVEEEGLLEILPWLILPFSSFTSLVCIGSTEVTLVDACFEG